MGERFVTRCHSPNLGISIGTATTKGDMLGERMACDSLGGGI
jgi:hypothetical protein